jgi:hypothetical protein
MGSHWPVLEERLTVVDVFRFAGSIAPPLLPEWGWAMGVRGLLVLFLSAGSAGREFTIQNTIDGPPVAIISAALAKKYFPKTNHSDARC